MKIEKYTFDNGKYEVQAADGSSLNAYRYGEFWQNMVGDNLTAAMLNRIDELEVMERFVGYLLDNCEREVIYEESLQYWLSEMLRKEKEKSE